MAITFNDIPDTIRTPGAHAEIDGSRALKGLVQNPHKVLIIGYGDAAATAGTTEGIKDTLDVVAITQDNMADGYFGNGCQLARMCTIFRDNNPNTEMYAVAISGGTAQASGAMQTSIALSAGGFSCVGGGTYYMMIAGEDIEVALTSTWSTTDVNSAIVDTINADSTLPVTASTNAASAVNIIAVCSGTNGNEIDIRDNYYTWQSMPAAFSGGDSVLITGMANGAGTADLDDIWAIIDDDRYNHILHPFIDTANLTSLEGELEDRFGPLIGLQGHGYTGLRGTQATCTSTGNARNSQFSTILGCYDSPTSPEEMAAALVGQASKALESDPARPLHFLKMKGVLPPPAENRFTRAERDILLYDGIATYRVDDGGNMLIDRCITTYQTNALSIKDPTYLDINTMFTLGEIRDQWLSRMSTRFLQPRFKLADDGFPVQPGTYVATPSLVKQETIALFTLLRDKGLIENLDDFIENLVVERDSADVNRVNCLLSPDLINQFRILASKIMFIL